MRYRKILPLFLALVLIVLAGCGGKSTGESTGNAGFSGLSSVSVKEADAKESGEDIIEPEELTEETPESEDAEGDAEESSADEASDPIEETPEISESDTPTEKEALAAYIHRYGHLPDNFITKSEAKALGWVSSEGNLDKVAPGCSIGGDYFGNYEGSLPEAQGRKYYECDVGYAGGYRDARRIIFSNDGLIYYTEDHYETFELLYGEEA